MVKVIQSGVQWNGQITPCQSVGVSCSGELISAIDSGHILALLRNQTVVIHSLEDLEKPVQVISLDPQLSAFHICYSPYGIAIRNLIRDERMQPTRLVLLGGKLIPPEPIPVSKVVSPPATTNQHQNPLDSGTSPPDIITSPANEEPPAGSGLTPPSSPPPFKRQPITPNRGSSLLQATAPVFRGPFSTAVAESLVIGPNGLQSLAPTSVILKVEKACEERNMPGAIALVDEERRKGRRGEVDADKVSFYSRPLLNELEYLH